MKMLKLAFTPDELSAASEEWGCNCGPAALAAALGASLRRVRQAVESAGFDAKGYMNPTMMCQAANDLDCVLVRDSTRRGNDRCVLRYRKAIVRVQWTGPWTQPGASAKWAYSKSHWIATFDVNSCDFAVYDINSGVVTLEDWKDDVAPKIAAEIPRADGGWFFTHVYSIMERGEA